MAATGLTLGSLAGSRSASFAGPFCAARIKLFSHSDRWFPLVFDPAKATDRSDCAPTLRSLYQIEVETVVLEQPPDLRFGEFATPLAFELARKLRKAPRKIAEEVVAALGAVPGFAAFEVAGAGYINARLDRAAR